MHILRSLVSIVVGLLLISAIVEPLEFGLVALLNGGVTTDPVVYFRVRNQPPVLAAKLVYNTIAAIAAGWVTALLAGRAPIAHAVTLAAIQTAAFAWAITTPRLRESTPDWMWAALILLTCVGITAGAHLRQRRHQRIPHVANSSLGA